MTNQAFLPSATARCIFCAPRNYLAACRLVNLTGNPNTYAAGPLDRAAHYRSDAAWLDTQLASAATRIVPLWQFKCLIDGPPSLPRLKALAATDPAWCQHARQPPVFLGIAKDGVAWFAVALDNLSSVDEPPLLGQDSAFVDLRAVGMLLPAGEAAILAYARALLWWHARHLYCGVCGTVARSSDGGHVRACTNPACSTSHFPRTDPAVIMLIHDGDRCLLGRQERFPPGMYSTLAGFAEPGESLEDAVAREVLEEAGVQVGQVRYHSSQPWPFPASIMLGFYGQALSTTIKVNTEELEAAAWFDRDFLTKCHDNDEFRLPRADSIARRLINDWVAGRHATIQPGIGRSGRARLIEGRGRRNRPSRER